MNPTYFPGGINARSLLLEISFHCFVGSKNLSLKANSGLFKARFLSDLTYLNVLYVTNIGPMYDIEHTVRNKYRQNTLDTLGYLL